jgi:hypothetical protein
MHVAPATPATVVFEQKFSDPVPCWKMQHLLLLASVQSAFDAQRRMIWLPVQPKTSVVGQLDAAAHADVVEVVVQLGIVPPSSAIVPQQTCEVPHVAGDRHVKPPSPGDEPASLALPASGRDPLPESLPPPEPVPPELVPPELVPPELVPPELVPPELVPPPSTPPEALLLLHPTRRSGATRA